MELQPLQPLQPLLNRRPQAALAGRFELVGVELDLPGAPLGGSLAQRVEALRVFLDEALGTGLFLRWAWGGGGHHSAARRA